MNWRAAAAFSGSSTSSMPLLRNIDSFVSGVAFVGVHKLLTARLLRAGRARDAIEAILDMKAIEVYSKSLSIEGTQL